MNDLLPALTVALAILLVTACTTTIITDSTACGDAPIPVPESIHLDTLDYDSPDTTWLVDDWLKLRDQVRACRGEYQPPQD